MRFFNIHSVAKHEKCEKKSFSGKNLTKPKKTERGDRLGFSNIHSVAKHQKNAEGPFGKKISGKKFLAVPKKMKGGTLWHRPVWCYAEKQVQPFWSRSLVQMVQFDTIILCSTFKNYFGQFVWIEKKCHHNSRVSLHEAPTKNWNISFCNLRVIRMKLSSLKSANLRL